MDDRNGFRQETRLNDGEVQVWRVDAAALAHECWWELLPDEVVRARGIRAKLAREEFVAGRGVLRRLLGRELDCEAREVRINVGAHGKPQVDGIHFNVAHSRGVVLIAISRAGAVGIDVEHGDREVEALEIARGSFHPEEIAWIERDGTAAFYRCWTRKEAVSKTDGRGLLMPLGDYSVCLEQEGAIEGRISLGRDASQSGYPGYPDGYHLRDMDMGPGVVATLALVRPDVRVTVCEFGGSPDANQELCLSLLLQEESSYVG